MIRYECDRCGARLSPNDHNRFIVKLEIFAAAGHIDVDAESLDSASDKLDAVLEELRHADPDEIEDQTYRSFRFDICDDCRRKVLAAPLG